MGTSRMGARFGGRVRSGPLAHHALSWFPIR